MTAHDHSVPTPELPENWDAMDNHAKERWLERQLTDRSKAIKTILKKEAGTQQGAWELRIAIGHQLEAARRLLPSDRAYGSWFKDQKFRCHPRWGRVLRTAARNEELVRGLHESQLPGGRPNFEQLVKLAQQPYIIRRQTSRSDDPPCPSVCFVTPILNLAEKLFPRTPGRGGRPVDHRLHDRLKAGISPHHGRHSRWLDFFPGDNCREGLPELRVLEKIRGAVGCKQHGIIG